MQLHSYCTERKIFIRSISLCFFYKALLSRKSKITISKLSSNFSSFLLFFLQQSLPYNTTMYATSQIQFSQIKAKIIEIYVSFMFLCENFFPLHILSYLANGNVNYEYFNNHVEYINWYKHVSIDQIFGNYIDYTIKNKSYFNSWSHDFCIVDFKITC